MGTAIELRSWEFHRSKMEVEAVEKQIPLALGMTTAWRDQCG
jgi:hypothetical protein